MNPYNLRLPYWDVIGAPVFVTFRLHGSLPANRVFQPVSVNHGRAFVAMDQLLDHPRSGPIFLQHPEVAGMVMDSLLDADRRFRRYTMHSYVVMPNHVHLLVTPKVCAWEWLRPMKAFTGYEALRILNLSGLPFWQDESCVHLVRNAVERERVIRYIEENPVKAGLVSVPEDFRWSSAARGESPAAGPKP